MTLLSRLSSTAGLRKETEAQRAIRRADLARDQRKWSRAAEQYRLALEEEEPQPHIWLQLGHVLKEDGRLTEALQAYQQATILCPTDADAHLHLAHLYKRLGYIDPSITHFLHSMHYGTDRKSEERELLDLLARQVERGHYIKVTEAVEALDLLPPGDEAPILGKLRDILAHDTPQAPTAEPQAGASQELSMVFDVSDLIGFWRSARLPTGIQRVQIEAIMGALARENGRAIHLCCFTSGRDDWLEVPLASFRQLADLATSAGAIDDPEWVEAVAELDLHLTLTRPFVFPYGALLINLGTSWWLQNYFLFVRHAKQTRGIRYIPFVHDMIPIITPEHCTEALTQDFISWALGVFDHADHFLVNSEATAKDLRKVAATLGHNVKTDDIAVIPLDSDFRKKSGSQLGAQALEQWQLGEGEFVLFVSTIESRKGHLTAFESWSRLIEQHGPDTVPQLVCVGNRGWLNDKVYERLATDVALSRKVTMLSGLSDAELALLYRSCRFTIYPSLYEGWGLPVTESLCYGKVPLSSNAASLPEAGGPFAVYFEAGNLDQLTENAARLITDDAYRTGLEDTIRAEFAPRSWRELAEQIVEELDHFAAADEGAGTIDKQVLAAPDAVPGKWYPLVRNRSTRIWQGMNSAENFRSDLGWYWPEDRGCRIRGTGGKLTMRLEAPSRKLRIYIGLRGDENVATHYRISMGRYSVEGRLRPDEISWTWFDLDPEDRDAVQTLAFAAKAMPDGALPTYFVRGFFPCLVEDSELRQDFVEAVSLGRLDMFDAYRENRSK